MSLTHIQSMVIGVLQEFRTPRDYVGGGAALNFDAFRLSDDMDIFHDLADALPSGVHRELDALRAGGFSVEMLHADNHTVEAIVRQYGFETRVQWMSDPETCRRFFAAVEHKVFGFALHQSDNAVNKVLCASRRSTAARDAVDLATLAENYCPLGPLVWAITSKDPSRGPLEIIRGIRQNTFGYSDDEIRTVRMGNGAEMTREHIRRILEPALDNAANYCEHVAPNDFYGCLFVDKKLIPGEATDDDLVKGRYDALPVQDFSAVPSFPE
ncbi:hypothetical protein [Dongia sp.]|uniref:hypothetical protein n=1 Tax=Dongia sp. TaxID=1977262 RepID=UPI0035AFBF67